jgi:hypothetical protein
MADCAKNSPSRALHHGLGTVAEIAHREQFALQHIVDVLDPLAQVEQPLVAGQGHRCSFAQQPVGKKGRQALGHALDAGTAALPPSSLRTREPANASRQAPVPVRRPGRGAARGR